MPNASTRSLMASSTSFGAFSSIIVGRLKDGDHLRHATRIAMDTLRNWIDINKDDKDKNRGIPIERHLGDL